MILQPTSEISHHHKVTNITMSPTSLSPHVKKSVTNFSTLSSSQIVSKVFHQQRQTESYLVKLTLITAVAVTIKLVIKNSWPLNNFIFDSIF